MAKDCTSEVNSGPPFLEICPPSDFEKIVGNWKDIGQNVNNSPIFEKFYNTRILVDFSPQTANPFLNPVSRYAPVYFESGFGC